MTHSGRRAVYYCIVFSVQASLSEDEKCCTPGVDPTFGPKELEVQITLLCHSESDIFLEQGVFSATSNISAIGFNSSLLFCGEMSPFFMACTFTYHPALYPRHAASGLPRVPESIARKGP